MNVFLDVQIATASGIAFGHVSGRVTLPKTPCAGELISFLSPPNDYVMPNINNFGGILKVRRVILEANNCEHVLVELEEINFDRTEDALAAIGYLKNAFGLSSAIY